MIFPAHNSSRWWCLLISVSRPQPSLFPVSQYKNNQLQRTCCLDGMKETLLSYTCERRSEYINDGEACVTAFLRCCKEMETQRAERKEDSLLLARSKTGTWQAVELWGYYLWSYWVKIVTFLMTLQVRRMTTVTWTATTLFLAASSLKVGCG